MHKRDVQPLSDQEFDLDYAEQAYKALLARGWSKEEAHTIALLHLAATVDNHGYRTQHPG